MKVDNRVPFRAKIQVYTVPFAGSLSGGDPHLLDSFDVVKSYNIIPTPSPWETLIVRLLQTAVMMLLYVIKNVLKWYLID